VLCLEESESLVEPLCSTQDLQKELVPYVMSNSLQNAAFLQMTKAERQTRVKALTQLLLGGESAGTADNADTDSQVSPQRFWAHLRAKYGTRQQHIECVLRLLEPHLRPRRIVVLRFEGEIAVPAASLVVRASADATPSTAMRHEFPPGGFDTSALAAWLSEDRGSRPSRAPPLWPRLIAECRACGASVVHALVLCTEAQSTDTTPESLELAARCLHMDCCKGVPYVSSIAFGPQSSEHLAALEELCAWAGGLSLNIGDPTALRPAAEGLAAHLFGDVQGRGPGLSERREFYARKQSLGTCFLKLPDLSRAAQDKAAALGESTADAIVGILSRSSGGNFDGSLPSEAMLAVLSDVAMTISKRWQRSLRSWRMHRGLRDVVFSESGNLGLEFNEPQHGSAADPSKRSWLLRATHPPASSLKMEEQSELVAINMVRVNHLTLRSEVARRIAARPVSLTFRSPKARRDAGDEASFQHGGAMIGMAAAEVVVSEMREGLPLLNFKNPPLSTTVQCITAARARSSRSGGAKEWQASRILQAVASWGTVEGANIPKWTEQLPDCSLLRDRAEAAVAGAASSAGPSAGRSAGEILASQPTHLIRSLLFCGEVLALARAGLACSCWRWLLLEGAQGQKANRGDGAPGAAAHGHDVRRQLWRWTLRWGTGPPAARRADFWRWVLRDEIGDSSAARNMPAGSSQAVLASAFKVDQAGLLELSQGLGGTAPGAQLSSSMLSRMLPELGAMPTDLFEALLKGPFHMQRIWLLTSAGLQWQIKESRCFQVLLAAHHSNVFKHCAGEGVAPELFYCLWSQALLHGCLGNAELLRLWDLFVFERSHKILFRAAIAIFVLLEKKILGKDDERIMRALFEQEGWQFADGEVLAKALELKVTRSMLRAIAEVSTLKPAGSS